MDTKEFVAVAFGSGGVITIGAALIGWFPSNRQARTAQRTYELEVRKAEAAEEKAKRDELRADLLRLAAELSQVKAERDRAEAERDEQRERADRAEHEHNMRLASCERHGNLCIAVMPAPTTAPPLGSGPKEGVSPS